MADGFDNWRSAFQLAASSRQGSSAFEDREPSLFYRRISTELPGFPNGQHISFRCITSDGSMFYCKDDRDGRPVRAVEWIATKLADHLGLSVAEAAIIEDDRGNTFFGSKSPRSLANQDEVFRHLTTPATGELGQPIPWLGQYLASLNAFDCFIDNPDRTLNNFILDNDGYPRRLRAIDFASARLIDFSAERFPVESENTVLVGRVVRDIHGAHAASGLEMLDRIAAVPLRKVQEIVEPMPNDWLTTNQREGLSEFWVHGGRTDRISRLRALLSDESQIRVCHSSVCRS